MTTERLDTLATIIDTTLQYSSNESIKRLERLLSDDDDPATALLCAASLTVFKANLTTFTDEEQRALNNFINLGESRAETIPKEATADALFVRGMTRLLRVVNDQANDRASDLNDFTTQGEVSKSMIQQALLIEPSNEVYQLIHAASLRFFPTSLKDPRKQEGVTRLETLSRANGIVAVAAKLMLADHAVRRGAWDSLLEITQDLKKVYPRASCMHTLGGVALRRLRQPAAAEKEFKAALRMNRRDTLAKLELDNLMELGESQRSRSESK